MIYTLIIPDGEIDKRDLVTHIPNVSPVNIWSWERKTCNTQIHLDFNMIRQRHSWVNKHCVLKFMEYEYSKRNVFVRKLLTHFKR